MVLNETTPKKILHYIKQNTNEDWATDKWTHAGITSLLGYLEDPFDKVHVAEGCMEKYFNDPGSKYFGMPVDEILQSWEASGNYKRNVGHLLDDYVFFKTGLYPNDDVLKGTLTEEEWRQMHALEINDYVSSLFEAFDSFYERIHKQPWIVPVGREIKVGYVLEDFSVKKNIEENIIGNDVVVNGCIDYLMFDNRRKKLMIFDWKTTENIKTKPDCLCHHMHGPLRDLIDMTITMYTLQTHFYKMAICEALDIDAEDVETYIVQLLPTKTYNIYKESHEYDAALLRAALYYAFQERLKDKNAKKWDASNTMRRTCANDGEIVERKRETAHSSKLKKLLNNNLETINQIISESS